MKTFTSTAVATVLATVIATLASVPAASAQERNWEAAPGRPSQMMIFRHDGGMPQMKQRRHLRDGDVGSGGLLHLACSEHGRDRLEHVLLSLKQRLDPTAEQQPLFEQLSRSALSAQADFAETCASVLPEARNAGTTIIERIEDRLALDTARIAAMRQVLPALEAFHDSLSDEQKSLLEPRKHKAMTRHMRGPGSPAAPAQPAAPDSAG